MSMVTKTELYILKGATEKFFFFFFAVYGSSQAGDQTGAAAEAYNTGPEPHLRPTLQCVATPDP